ncbi:hypothetical protein BT93_E2126 [Corymbia citriodora subsp. variegata]|nr:hypothetical protein BT93_E2126 [Corymbia citriodora subsp. variegata]
MNMACGRENRPGEFSRSMQESRRATVVPKVMDACSLALKAKSQRTSTNQYVNSCTQIWH